MKCSECSYSKYSNHFSGYTCNHENCKEVSIFKGKTKPHYCPLTGGKKYRVHGNSGRNTGNLSWDMVHYYHG